MKAPSFEYLAATTIDEVVEVLASSDEAKVLAGGQSLVPLLNLRLARPSVLVDINALPGLADAARDNGQVRLGALCRHTQLEVDPVVVAAAPLLAEAASLVATPAIRNRGTLGGSISHGDAVGELPTALVALGGTVTVRGRDATRTIAAGDLYQGFLTTTIAPDELVTEIVVPAAGAGDGSAFVEFAPRLGDFAVVGMAVTLSQRGGACTAIRGAGAGIGPMPIDLSDAFADVLDASELTDALLTSVAGRVASGVAPTDDVHGSAEYRRELAQVLTVKALRLAWRRAIEANERVEA